MGCAEFLRVVAAIRARIPHVHSFSNGPALRLESCSGDLKMLCASPWTQCVALASSSLHLHSSTSICDVMDMLSAWLDGQQRASPCVFGLAREKVIAAAVQHMDLRQRNWFDMWIRDCSQDFRNLPVNTASQLWRRASDFVGLFWDFDDEGGSVVPAMDTAVPDDQGNYLARSRELARELCHAGEDD